MHINDLFTGRTFVMQKYILVWGTKFDKYYLLKVKMIIILGEIK